MARNEEADREGTRRETTGREGSDRASSRKVSKRRGAPLPIQLLQYAGFRFLERAVRLLPVDWLYAIGGALGSLAYRLDGRHRRVAMRNLEIAYGDELDEASRRRIAKGAFRNMVWIALDVLVIPRLLRRDNLERFVEVQAMTEADRVRREHGKVVYVTAHYGSWEILGAGMGVVGHSFHAVARPMGNRFINDYLIRSRESLGQNIVSKYGVIGELIRRLRAGDSLGFVADQDARRHGVFVDFFGVPCSTIPSPALLAYRFGVPMVVGHARRVGGRFRFRVDVDAVVLPDLDRPRDEEVLRMTRLMSDAFEKCIREEPDQYLWLHRKFKTRPEGEPPAYGPEPLAPRSSKGVSR